MGWNHQLVKDVDGIDVIEDLQLTENNSNIPSINGVKEPVKMAYQRYLLKIIGFSMHLEMDGWKMTISVLGPGAFQWWAVSFREF